MKKKAFFIFIFSFLIISCENINDVEISLDSIEYVVVQSELEGDADFKGVIFTKTLPVDEVYDIKKAELKDVRAFLKINNSQVIPLIYFNDGMYKPTGDLKIMVGNTYELFAKWGDKSIYSKTIIPKKPVAMNTVYQDYGLSSNVLAQDGEVYGALWKIISNENEISQAEDFYAIADANTTSNLLSIRTQEIPEKYQSNPFKQMTYMELYAFDKPFFEFFKSKSSSGSVNNIFVGNGNPVETNIIGDNVTGLFIGYTKSELIKPSIIN